MPRPDLSSTRSDERGNILIMTAMLIVPLMLMVGFSTDVGAWYARASRIQRAADAASLAGVVWMPDLAKATTAALAAAQRNGFQPGVNNIDIDVARDSADPTRRLKVTITDHNAKSFFGRMVIDHISIARTSEAEYVLPVPLGSPTNTLGTGNLLGGSSNENFWLAASGSCSSKENGDLLLPATDGNYFNGTINCNGSEVNADHDPRGYLYAVDLAQAPGQNVAIEVYDAGFVPNSTAGDQQNRTGATITTTYVVRDQSPSPFSDPYTNPVLATLTTNSANAASYANVWTALKVLQNPAAGRYYVQVYTSDGEASSWGSNSFALRARTGSSFTTCSTIPGAANYNAACPQVHGVSNMSIYANLNSAVNGKAVFYLADVGAVHAGKQMQVSLFDPGEGAQAIELLDPNGNPANFTWTTDCTPPIVAPVGGCSGSGNSLDVSGGPYPQPGPNRGSTSKYSDRTMVLTVQLPSNYATAYGGKTWWKVRYTVGSSSTDRTTWSVAIIGDPVHLINEH